MRFSDFISRFEKPRRSPKGWMVRCPSHEDSTPSLQLSEAADGKILLKCFAGCETASVVKSLGLEMKDLFPDAPLKVFSPPKAAKATNGAPTKSVIDKIYSYTDATGQETYQAVRMKPKSFRQRHRDADEWVWNMDGVERVLYHLPDVLLADEVWIVEGEKDADNLLPLGFVATCNVGGAGKWLDAYTEALLGKNIIICGDNDEAGEKHIKLIFDSIAGKAKTVRVLRLPKEIKDVSDFLLAFDSPEEGKAALMQLHDASHPFVNGVKLPIYNMSELEQRYHRHVLGIGVNSFDLGKWLPTLGKIRPLVPGELVFIIGDTGAGKTGIIQAIGRAALPLPTLLFELELPAELLYERFVAGATRTPCRDVEQAYRDGNGSNFKQAEHFDNLFVCPESRLSLQDFENYIVRSELKIGQKPRVVLIDYIQLVQAQGVNRREKVSDIAEGLKVLAKTTNTILIVASQVRRPTEESPDITLHSAKESGSIESSCGLLLGAWRDSEDISLMHIQVLKSTKGGGGMHIECNFDGARMLITERIQEPTSFQ